MAIAAALYFSNIAFNYTRPSVTVTQSYMVYNRVVRGDEYLIDEPHLHCCYHGGKYLVETHFPASYLRVYTLVGPIDNNPSTNYCLYVNLTALKQLKYIRVHVSVRTRTGAPPAWAGNPDATWEDTNVPSFWFVSRYWCPIRPDEFPLRVAVQVEVPGP